MKLLFFKSNLLMQEDLQETLLREGHEVHPVTYNFSDFERDDFFPVISDVCKELKIQYISWLYDSPIPNFVRFDTSYNHIWCFDKQETKACNEKGYAQIAKNGYEKVKALHTYEARFPVLLSSLCERRLQNLLPAYRTDSTVKAVRMMNGILPKSLWPYQPRFFLSGLSFHIRYTRPDNRP